MGETLDCTACSNYCYDPEWDDYSCVICLDEDQMADFLRRQVRGCPFFQFNDEYVLARKQ